MKDAYYFPHFCNARHDRKLKRVVKELGLEGYGIYFMLLEVLREQSDLKYPMGDIDLLADEFGTSEPKLKTVVCNYNLFTIDESEMFFSPKMVMFLQPYYEKKERMRHLGVRSGEVRREKIERTFNERSNVRSTCAQRAFEHTLSKESKVNKRKEKKSKEKEKEYKDGVEWRSSFDGYYSWVLSETRNVIADEGYINHLAGLYPNLDVKMSIIKAAKNFWLTDDGWKNKKRKRGNPDWRSTYRKAVAQKFNQVSSGTHFFDEDSNYAEI